jgi:hypothetical protein
LKKEVIEEKGIHSPGGDDWSMNMIFPWAVDIVLQEMKKVR